MRRVILAEIVCNSERDAHLIQDKILAMQDGSIRHLVVDRIEDDHSEWSFYESK